MFAANTKEGMKMDIKNAERKLDQDGRATADHLTDDINDFANKAGRKVRSYYNSASNEITNDYDMVASRIRSNPVQASLVALGAGVILGALLRRL